MNPCQAAFDQGIKWRTNQRQSFPMAYAKYKINETSQNWFWYRDELIAIGRCASRDKSARNALRHCTPDTKASWVKSLPVSMIHSFSLNVAAVLYALPGDGISISGVLELERMVDAQVPRLIALGEQARLEAKNDWPRLSKSLAHGNGLIFEFVAELQDSVDQVLATIRAIKV